MAKNEEVNMEYLVVIPFHSYECAADALNEMPYQGKVMEVREMPYEEIWSLLQ